MKNQVCQFPDGNGGFIAKVMDEQGNWVACDDEGNIIEQPAAKKPAVQEEKPVERKKGSRKVVKSSKESKSAGSFRFSFLTDMETGRLVTEYSLWYFHRHGVRICFKDIFIEAVRTYLKKEQEFQDYLSTH